MKPLAYYNEIDRGAAQWLRELIHEGFLPAGDVDDRSVADVVPGDLDGYVQCHFFAGIGGWPYALRLAGWPDGQPVWTGSPPCQPFSTAGRKRGFEDERHLWPHFARLIRELRPAIVLGEQVASRDGLVWLDAVRADLEDADYSCGAADLCAAGVGAPHIRQRLYWCAARNGADLAGIRLAHPGLRGGGRQDVRTEGGQLQADGGRRPGGMAHGAGDGLQDRDLEGAGGRRLPGEPGVLDAAVRVDGGRDVLRSEGAAGEGRPGRGVREDSPGGMAHSPDGFRTVPGTEGAGPSAADAAGGGGSFGLERGQGDGRQGDVLAGGGGRPGDGPSCPGGMALADLAGRGRPDGGQDGGLPQAAGPEPHVGMGDSDVVRVQRRLSAWEDSEREVVERPSGPLGEAGELAPGAERGMEVSDLHGRDRERHPGEGSGEEGRSAASDGAEPAGGMADPDVEGRQGRLLGPAGEERPSEADGPRSVGEPGEVGELLSLLGWRPFGAARRVEDSDGVRLARDEAGGEPVRDAESEGADEVRGVVLAEGLGRRGGSEGDQAGLPGQLQAGGLCDGCGLEHACRLGRQGRICGRTDQEREALLGPPGPDRAALRNPWTRADWLYCRDGKYRPALPGVFPLVDGFSERVGLLRGYGNAICPPLAAVFVEAFVGALRDRARCR